MDISKVQKYANRLKLEENGLDRKIIAKATGVTFDNRQELLTKIVKDTPIKLERDRRNKFDFYAVNILAEIDGEWQQVGFIPKKMNKDICRTLDNGKALNCSVHRVTGGGTFAGTDEPLNYGLEITIVPNLI